MLLVQTIPKSSQARGASSFVRTQSSGLLVFPSESSFLSYKKGMCLQIVVFCKSVHIDPKPPLIFSCLCPF